MALWSLVSRDETEHSYEISQQRAEKSSGITRGREVGEKWELWRYEREEEQEQDDDDASKHHLMGWKPRHKNHSVEWGSLEKQHSTCKNTASGVKLKFHWDQFPRNFRVANVTGKSPTSYEEVGRVASLLRGSYEETGDFQTISTCQDGLATSLTSS